MGLGLNAHFSARTRQWARRCHFLNELMAEGKIRAHHVPSINELADVLADFLYKKLTSTHC